MTEQNPHDAARRCGALAEGDTAPSGTPSRTTRWRVWAPNARQVELVLLGDERRVRPMTPEKFGYFTHVEPGVREGQRYAYRLDGGPERPDPCSLWQPDGVHTPSAVYFPGHFAWSDHGWQGVRHEDLVFYELHVGTFTPEGTFEAVIPRLRDLRDLGVTAIEIMPAGQFPGTRNWGYDGVHPYAAQNSYGGPRGLQKLVDVCHREGLAVFLDVVYNHLGPEGNYLAEFGPYFTDRYRTPWGTALNFDGGGSDAVRDFVLNNARTWLEEFHLDGLRLDAVHAIFDLGAQHLLRDFARMAEEASTRAGRPLHVIAESDLNDPRLLVAPDRGGFGLAGQWADDFHHAVHAFFTGERQGYYSEFGTPAQLARVIGRPFLFAGDYSPHRGRTHGAPVPADLDGSRFVVCIQNHDQVGNRARGDRLGKLVRSPAKQRLAASLLLLSPYVPLLFMGEEYGEENPFPFFCSFGDPGLVRAVREGRKREFAAFAWQGEVPDPQDEATFASARLSWSWPEGTPHAALRRLYADLLSARRVWPALRDFTRRPARLWPDGEAGPVLEFVRGEGDGTVRVLCNLSGQPQPLPTPPAEGSRLLFTSEGGRYQGGRQPGPLDGLLPSECAVLGPAGLNTFV